LAYATLAHYGRDGQLLQHGRVVVYRMMDAVLNAIETVGPPIRIWVQDGRVFRELTDDEMTETNEQVGLWKSVEAESLREVFQLGTAPS
jgi:hypothetical protein